jgi:hypothetical protein
LRRDYLGTSRGAADQAGQVLAGGEAEQERLDIIPIRSEELQSSPLQIIGGASGAEPGFFTRR